MLEAEFTKRLNSFVLNAKLKGEGWTCVTGKNGSGKTTLLNCLSGIYQIDSGFIKLDGLDISRIPLEKRGFVLVNPNTYIPSLSVDEHIRWGFRLKKIEVKEEELQKVKQALGINFEGRVSKLSVGQRIRVSLATALLAQPKAILVDEAFSNISEKQSFLKEFKTLTKERRIMVIYTTQEIDDSRFSEYHYHIEDGVLNALKQV